MAGSCVFLFPGQGSQYVGMGKSLFDRYSSVQRLFEEASQVVRKNLEKLCFEGPDRQRATGNYSGEPCLLSGAP
jgi:[acyl-carrier-protein] S-malonyltransferase